MMSKSLRESIKSFIRNLSNDNYANANKDLKQAIAYKLQERIKRAYKKDLF